MNDRNPGIRRPLESGAYDDDLAYVHDVGYNGVADGAAPGLLTILQKASIDEGLVVDLGCGSGIWARHLTNAGYHVLGVDISTAMIERAKPRAPEAEFRVDSFLRVKLPRCRAITAIGEVLCYQFDESNDRQALARLFRKAHEALEPGGVMIFDIAEVGLDKDRPPTFREGDDWVCLVRFEHIAKHAELIRHITTFRRVGDLYRRHEETHRIRLYRRREIATLLAAAGFQCRAVRKFGKYPLLPKRIGFIAKKK